jgi:2,5-diamino-6-(ribosylamino)-4(3H)-pyrimidinone 5'-phosphate reductase
MSNLIVHNSISLDGSLVNFEADMGLHYQIAGRYEPDIHLVGSSTARAGMDLFGPLPEEEEKDRVKPDRGDDLPYWVIPDTRGILRGLLHACRAFEHCRDVVVLISERTPEEYIQYLEERDYEYHSVGTDHIDLRKALGLLAREYGGRTILTDTGRTLGNLLLAEGLASEVSLLVHPVIVGSGTYAIFGGLEQTLALSLLESEAFDNGCVWSRYRVVGAAPGSRSP